MRFLELKSWAIWLLFLLCLLAVTSCKTKDINLQKSKKEVKVNLKDDNKTNIEAAVHTVNQIDQTELKELVSMLQNLNIGYDGRELNDRLDFLLNKTTEGTKLTIKGKGTASYTENNKYQFELLKSEIFKRQDSLYNLRAEAIRSLELDLREYFKKKDKVVKVKGFQAGTYITIVIVIIILVILAWIAKRYKLFSRFKTNKKEVF